MRWLIYHYALENRGYILNKTLFKKSHFKTSFLIYHVISQVNSTREYENHVALQALIRAALVTVNRDTHCVIILHKYNRNCD